MSASVRYLAVNAKKGLCESGEREEKRKALAAVHSVYVVCAAAQTGRGPI